MHPLLPVPGVPYTLPGAAGLAPRAKACLGMHAPFRPGGTLIAIDNAEDLLPHSDELGAGFDAATISMLQIAPVEIQRESMSDASWARRHDDYARPQEQCLFYTVGNEKVHLAGP